MVSCTNRLLSRHSHTPTHNKDTFPGNTEISFSASLSPSRMSGRIQSSPARRPQPQRALRTLGSFPSLRFAFYFPKQGHHSGCSAAFLTPPNRGCYLEDINWYLIANLIPTAAISNLSHAQARKPEPQAKPTLQLNISRRFTTY